MTKILGKAELLSGELLRRELVDLPGKDVSVWMRQMTGEHVLEFKRIVDELKAQDVKQTTLEQDIKIMTVVISFSACDENGKLLFDTPEEAGGLVVNDFNLLMDLGNKALEISGTQATPGGMTGEAKNTLPNGLTTSLSGSSRKNLRKRAAKS